MPDPVLPRPPPFRLPNEHYLRIPLGDGDRAINIFTSAQNTFGFRGAGLVGGGASGGSVGATFEAMGPALVLRDPWFAAALRPTLGLHAMQSALAPELRLSPTFGATLPVYLNFHDSAPAFVPRLGGGVVVDLSSGVRGYFEAGVDFPVTTGSGGAFSLGVGYRYESDGSHFGTLSVPLDFGDYSSRALRGGLFREETATEAE